MGFRFGKSIKVCKGVRLNLSSSGVGISAGVKGARISAGPRGVRATASIPGTGISYSQSLSGSSSRTKNYSNSSKYEEWIRNDYLGKEKLIKANSSWELQLKMESELEKWKVQEERARNKERVNDLKEQAFEMTEEAKEKLEELRNILNYTLEVDDKLDWDSQKDTSQYKGFTYDLPEPNLKDIYTELRVPKKSFFEIIFKGLRIKRENLETEATLIFNKRNEEYFTNKNLSYSKYLKDKDNFYDKQKLKNDKIDRWRRNFENNDVDAIERYIEVILGNSVYPYPINMEYEVDYLSEEKKVLVSFRLPHPNEIPNNIEYKYSPTKKEIVSKCLNKTETSLLYDNTIFQITLRTIHEIFEAVYTNSVESIIFNGWVESVDEATGNETLTCIISVEANRGQFEKIDLSRIEYKACLDSLGAVYKKNLIKLQPIEPILDINKDNEYFEVEEAEEEVV